MFFGDQRLEGIPVEDIRQATRSADLREANRWTAYRILIFGDDFNLLHGGGGQVTILESSSTDAKNRPIQNGTQI
jgi:hypothetical protein